MNEMDEVLRSNSCSGFNEEELAELKSIAVLHDDADNLFMKLVNWAGEGAAGLLDQLPEGWQEKLQDASAAALQSAYDVAHSSHAVGDTDTWLNNALAWAEGETWHRCAAAVTGALGGFGGVATTLVDLPVTTTLILRSIQQIAQSYEEDLSDPSVREQCITVFALGGPLPKDDGTDVSIWAVRLSLTGKTVAALIQVTAARYSIIVSQKMLAQATPLLGALAGGAINPIFTQYYQTMAHVHFRLRHIERSHDPGQVKSCFERIVKALEK